MRQQNVLQQTGAWYAQPEEHVRSSLNEVLVLFRHVDKYSLVQ